MRRNPLVDIFAFLIGPSYGEPAFMTVLYWIVALATLAVAATAALRLEGQGAPIIWDASSSASSSAAGAGNRPCGNTRRSWRPRRLD